VDGGRALGAQSVGVCVACHDGGVGTHVRGGEVRAAPLGVPLEEIGDAGIEPQRGHRDVEASGDGDESFACPRRDGRRLGEHL
jgi:hypothetical protein